MSMVWIKVTFADAKPVPRVFEVEVDPWVEVDDSLKAEILEILGRGMGVALDPHHYRLDWQGSFEKPHFIMRLI